jgi:hypothetical protein
MTPDATAVRRTAGSIALLLSTLLLAGCAIGGASPTFDPSAPCTADQRAGGAYPELEALVPRAFDGKAPTTLDSGRNCSAAALGMFGSHDVREVRFAGAVWDLGNGTGVTLALLALPSSPMPVAWAEEFYEIGAKTAKRTENIQTSRATFAGLASPVFRLDTLNDLSFQTIVVWGDGPIARVVIVASPVTLGASRDAHDALVEQAVAAALAAVPAASPAG